MIGLFSRELHCIYRIISKNNLNMHSIIFLAESTERETKKTYSNGSRVKRLKKRRTSINVYREKCSEPRNKGTECTNIFCLFSKCLNLEGKKVLFHRVSFLNSAFFLRIYAKGWYHLHFFQ